MNTSQILKIYEFVSERDRTGVSFLEIARETRIPVALVRKHLIEFSNTFVSVGGGARYTLNRFSGSKNLKESLVLQVEKTKREQDLAWLGFAVFFCGLVMSISAISFQGS
jgi:hypothetical protein